MLESYLQSGAQEWNYPLKRGSRGSSSCLKEQDLLVPGLSLTDSCLGWEETESLLVEIAELLKRSF